MRYIAGRRANLIAQSLVVTSSPLHARLGPQYLSDGDPGIPCAGGTTSPWEIVVDGRTRQLDDPHFDAAWAGAPTGWTHVGAGSIARDTADTSAGAGASVRLDNGAQVARWIEVAPGHRADLVVALKGGVAEGGIRFEVVAEDGTQLALLSRAAGTGWGDHSAQIVVPDTGTDLVRLRLSAARTGSAASVWLDDLRWLPQADMLALHDVRMPTLPRATLTWSYSDSATSEAWTQLGQLDARPDAWLTWTRRSARRWRLRAAISLMGDAALQQVPSIGEAVLGVGRVLGESWHTLERTLEQPQTRAGDHARHRQAETPGPVVRLEFSRWGSADVGGWIETERLHALTLGGVLPVSLVWDEDDPGAAFCGVLAPELGSKLEVGDPDRPHSLELQGFPPALWTP